MKREIRIMLDSDEYNKIQKRAEELLLKPCHYVKLLVGKDISGK